MNSTRVSIVRSELLMSPFVMPFRRHLERTNERTRRRAVVDCLLAADDVRPFVGGPAAATDDRLPARARLGGWVVRVLFANRWTDASHCVPSVRTVDDGAISLI